MASGAVIDFDAIEKEVAGMSEQEAREKLFKFTVRAKKAQKASYNPERAKVYRQKVQAEYNALKARAAQLGILDEIQAQAKEAVEAEDAADAIEA